ncbi:MAG TPA: uracil-DNA glycosylase family protein [Chitinophagaceae bacterium]|nr:uracil-DNA glycosylase family protein [Chitinophagaceae bacterium]
MQPMADKLISFYQSIKPPRNLPAGIEVLFPQKDKQVQDLVKNFFTKYFDDDRPRNLLFGINPGRHGAGITGVNFTAPKQLKEYCGIDHPLKLSSELSAEFIYDMIGEYGGVKEFYNDWFIGAVCPLGFVTSSAAGPTLNPSKGGEATHKAPSGKNINYYDDKKLLNAVTPFIIDCINKQVAMGFNTERCLCIGGEKNFKFLSVLNNEHKWFNEIIPLPHPRFILQYRRKQKDQYIHQYLSAMKCK